MRVAHMGGLAVALAAGGAGLLGCNRDDPVADTIQSAAIDLNAMSPGSAPSVVPALDAQAYTKLIAKLKSVGGRGGAGQQAAVSLLTARAQFGLAGQAAAEASALERSALSAAAGVRAALQQYLTYSAQANALSQFDPAPLLADLDKQITQREADLAKARKQRQDIDARVAAFRSQSQAKMDQAAAEHNAEAELRAQAIRVSDAKAADLIVEANKRRRVADAFDVEASTLDAQAAQVAPEAPEAQLLIDQLSNQRDQLGKGREEVLRRAEDNRKLAAEARADQAKAADALDVAIKAMTSAREGPLPEKYGAADKLFGEAVASANKAAGANRPQSKLAAAEGLQATGGLLWMKAQGFGTVAATLEDVAAANPPLPRQADYARLAMEARAAQKESLDAATRAYQDAKAAYEASGVKGDAAPRIEEISKNLAAILLKTSGGSVDLRSGEQGQTAPPEAPAPADGAGGPTAAADSPQATVDAMIAANAAGKFEELSAYLYIPDPAARGVKDAMMAMLAKARRLDEACKAKLGAGLSDQPNSVLAGAKFNFGGVDAAGGFKGSDLTYNLTGDTATATGANLPEPIRFRRVEGKWLIDGTNPTGVNEQQMQAAAAMIPLMTKAIDDVTAEVQAGKYKTVEEVNTALMTRIMSGGAGPGGG